MPPVDGLSDAGFLTNESVFSLTDLPGRLLVFGAGPIGCEMAQAFRRFGSEVTIIERAPQFLTREDPDAAAIVSGAFLRDGIDVRLNTVVTGVAAAGKEKTGTSPESRRLRRRGYRGRDPDRRRARAQHQGAEASRRQGSRSIRKRESRSTISCRPATPAYYAAGDVCQARNFTHTADAAARIVIQNALFRGRKRYSAFTIPWCTYTDPEIAHVGMYERDAREQGDPGRRSCGR